MLREAVIKRCLKRDQKEGKPWCLYSKSKKKGKRRLLGRHKTKESALKQERAIQVRKHGQAPTKVLYRSAVYQLVGSTPSVEKTIFTKDAAKELWLNSIHELLAQVQELKNQNATVCDQFDAIKQLLARVKLAADNLGRLCQ